MCDAVLLVNYLKSIEYRHGRDDIYVHRDGSVVDVSHQLFDAIGQCMEMVEMMTSSCVIMRHMTSRQVHLVQQLVHARPSIKEVILHGCHSDVERALSCALNNVIIRSDT